MDQPTPTTPAPVTEDAFLADRKAFWGWFTSATFFAATFVAVALVLLAWFLL